MVIGRGRSLRVGRFILGESKDSVQVDFRCFIFPDTPTCFFRTDRITEGEKDSPPAVM